jgi:xylose dehydrogenase (NAD/NADP)
MANPTRWGVISTAKIGRGTVIPAIKASRNGKVLAIASRNLEQARKTADELGIERAYGSYEELLADPDVDAIYNPLPNDIHAEWSIAAAKAGKPTLCEKPLALNAAQAQEVADAFRAQNVLLAEAFMYRYHPQHARARQLIDSGELGPLKLIDVCFTFSLAETETKNIRLKPERGGGGLMDVGCYCVNLCRMMAGQEPEEVTAEAVYGTQTGVDELFVGTLRFPNGVLAHFDCGVRADFRNSYSLVCQQGVIKADLAFRPVDGGEATLQVQRNRSNKETITIPASHQYVMMIEDFSDAVQQGRKTTYDPADSVKNMRVLDALARAARERTVVRL